MLSMAYQLKEHLSPRVIGAVFTDFSLLMQLLKEWGLEIFIPGPYSVNNTLILLKSNLISILSNFDSFSVLYHRDKISTTAQMHTTCIPNLPEQDDNRWTGLSTSIKTGIFPKTYNKYPLQPWAIMIYHHLRNTMHILPSHWFWQYCLQMKIRDPHQWNINTQNLPRNQSNRTL